jgi:EAL domain-containing protein (putative c-di-GMP-specific phosphodiesterase class I)
VASAILEKPQLHRALEAGEYVLHYQPKLTVVGRKLAGFEALIRWNSPEAGLLPPARFLPALEANGMILEVGRWALAEAAATAARWLDAGPLPGPISVNVSSVELHRGDLAEEVRAALAPLADFPNGGSYIELEITESMLMQDREACAAKLAAVRARGISIALDDFGTGYSSLAYLGQLPVDTLKIHGSFIAQMTSDPDSMAIVHAIIGLAHALRFKVTAEGVETEDQLRLLHLLRCDYAQGYLLGRPMPEPQARRLLEA